LSGEALRFVEAKGELSSTTTKFSGQKVSASDKESPPASSDKLLTDEDSRPPPSVPDAEQRAKAISLCVSC
jgi:hypothetical protein